MDSNWRRKHNAFYQLPNGGFVIESSLPLWQAVLGTGLLLLCVGGPWPPLYAYEIPQVCALVLLLAAVGLLYKGLFSRLEIGPAGVVLRRLGWFWPAVRVPLAAVVLDATHLVPSGPVSRAWSDRQLHLGYGPAFDDDTEQFLIVYRGWDLGHILDDEFAWTHVQQALAQLQTNGVGRGQ